MRETRGLHETRGLREARGQLLPVADVFDNISEPPLLDAQVYLPTPLTTPLKEGKGTSNITFDTH